MKKVILKTKILALSLVLTTLSISTISLIGCQKDKNSHSTQSSQSNTKLVMAAKESTNFISFTDEQIDSIGIVHNEMLNDVLSKLDYSQLSNGNTFDFLRTVFINTDFGSTSGDFRAATFDSTNLWVKQGIVTPNVQNYMDLITNGLESNEQMKDISTYLSSLTSKVDADQNLSQLEKQTVKIGISVALHSSQYWLPTEYGGSGEGYAQYVKISQAMGNGTPTLTAARTSITHIVASDAVGGCTGGIGFCISACFGPVGVGAYVFALGFGAASASLVTAAGL